MKKLFFLLTAFFFRAVFFACAEAPVPAAGLSPQEKNGDTQVLDQKMEGFNLVGYNEGGTKSWDINGDKANIFGDQVSVTNVDANAYGEDDMNLKAKKGLINKATGDVKLEQEVVITSQSGREMKTDTLEWQRGNDLVQTSDKVILKDDSMIIQGTGLQARPTLKEATLNSDVKADIAMPVSAGGKENRIQITSDGPMELEQASLRAIFRDHVVAVELVSGRKLKADMMEVHFDKDTQKIREIICMGHVELQQGENVTYSEMLVYKADEQRVVLTGKPKLLIDAGKIDTQKVFQY